MSDFCILNLPFGLVFVFGWIEERLPFLNLIQFNLYITKACQDIPSQYISKGVEMNTINSRVERSTGIFKVKV